MRTTSLILGGLLLLVAAAPPARASGGAVVNLSRVTIKDPQKFAAWAVQDHALRRRETLVRRGELFKKITQRGDYTGEHVLYRDGHVTAFLDLTDPQHPGHRAETGRIEDGEGEARARNPNRAHILVVPNDPREHIGKSLSGTLGSDDLQAALDVVKKAEGLAGRLGIKNPQVFINTQDRLSVGYLHVHIIGERDPARPYPAAMPSPK
jgi:diadenosine tetraphosphate (Ap4A) HIT family hydrolase